MTDLDWALAEEQLLLWEYQVDPSAKSHMVYTAHLKRHQWSEIMYF